MIEKTSSLTCLNPCFNGRYSQSAQVKVVSERHLLIAVLILVLMEDTLRAFFLFVLLVVSFVLILVLMEDTLRGVRL